MSSKPVFLVLEDMEIRIDFLRNTFGDAVEVVWAEDVTTFRQKLAGISPERLCAVILDHDLAPPGTPMKDKHGLDGTDAAKDLKVNVPVFVWSMNPVGAVRMVKILRESGHSCRHIPFGESNKVHLASNLVQAMLLWRKK